VIASFPKVGKSCLFQSCRDGFIFNFDLSSTTSPSPRAVMWPVVDASGACLLDNGPGLLSWDLCQSKIDTLLFLARTNAPRPRIIFFDSLTTWIGLLQPWITAHAQDLRISASPCTDWKQLHGPAAYDTLFSLVVSTINTLYNAGYGVYTAIHVLNDTVAVGENELKVEPSLSASAGLWKRLYPLMEFVAIMDRRLVPRSRVNRRSRTVSGVTTYFEVPESYNADCRFLSVDTPMFSKISGGRTQFSPTEIPKADGWAAFESSYAAAVVVAMTPSPDLSTVVPAP